MSNRSPRLVLRWDSQTLGITGASVVQMLDAGEPRIAVSGADRRSGQTPDGSGDAGISIVSAMMTAGDEKIVAERIHQVLSGKHVLKPAEPPTSPSTNVSGRWDVDIRYAAGAATHMLHLQQDGNRLDGIHRGDFLTRDISGTISGDRVTLASIVTERHGDALTYRSPGR